MYVLLSYFVLLIRITREIVIAHSCFKVEGFLLVQWFPNFGLNLELCRLLYLQVQCKSKSFLEKT